MVKNQVLETYKKRLIPRRISGFNGDELINAKVTIEDTFQFMCRKGTNMCRGTTNICRGATQFSKATIT